ncbi:MAG: TonB-dependent receptor [Candidatus Acidiferrales bacterium]
MAASVLPEGRIAGCCRGFGAALSLLILLAAPVCVAQGSRVEGVVRDSSGAAVTGAQVELHAGSFSASTVSDASGAFSFENVSASSGTLEVTAKGFARSEKSWSRSDGQAVHLEIVLAPSTVDQQVEVTANRAATLLSDVPVSDVQLTREDLQNTPALEIDDDLRQVPGFSLYRRSSSRTANPTTQGVSLRGLGANGASRALVLEDGIPLNDPFGGWVYWDRVPAESITDVEISQEGASSLYGSDALGGVVQFISRPAQPGGISLETSYGNQNTPDLSLWAGGQKGKWESTFTGGVFNTDGYILTPQADRGTVDVNAGSRDGTADLMVGREIGEHSEIFARGSYLDETRGNGTPLQRNDTKLGQGSLGANLQLGNLGALTLRFYAEAETYHQTFSAVAADRDSETLTDLQTVPSQGVGGSALWSRQAGKRQTLVAGFDYHEEIGASHEVLLSGGTTDLTSGGRQRTVGIFGEDLIQIAPRWLLTASVREDHWSNFDASTLRIPVMPPNPPTDTIYPDRSQNAFSPRLTLRNQINSHVSWNASLYRAFRAPTLNELYRSFRQGNTVTESNANLIAEHLSGGDAGVAVTGFNGKIEARGTVFYNQIVDPVANVTLTTTPTLITRQRQNLGRINAPGIELGATAHITRKFDLSAGYQFVDSKVSSFPSNTALVGLWVAQVPHNAFTFQARYANPRIATVSVTGRAIGNAFDDDQNMYPLGSFFVLDAMVSRNVGASLEVYGAVENLFNEQYYTAATPVPQLGLPIAGRVGLRFQFPRQ